MIVSQTAFSDALFDPKATAPDGLINPDGAPATKRYDVYRNNVAVSLTEALEATFPVIRKLVGDSFFSAMAGVYLRTHKPTSPLMMFYGDAMPQFLQRFEPARSLAYLPDIARLELAMRRAYHAADATPTGAEKLAAVAPDALMALRFAFAPSVQIITSAFPIYAIYRMNTVTGASKPVMQPESVLVTRPAFDPEIHSVAATSAACIAALLTGAPLGVAMAQAGENDDLGAILGLLLQQGAITDLI